MRAASGAVGKRRIGKILLRDRGGRRTRATGRPGRRVAAMVGVVTLALTGCASQDPAMPAPPEQAEPVVVAVDGGIVQQTVLAEVYAGALERRGREAAVEPVASDERVIAVQSGAATMSFGCTGELLGLVDPTTARELADAYLADDDPGKALSAEWRDRVYAALSEALPGEIMATDPSNAQGCGREDGLTADEEKALAAGVAEFPGLVLPQHVVPFYRKPALTRADRVNVLNRVAGSLSTEELGQMTAHVREGAPAGEVAGQWLDTSRFATG